MRDLVFDENTMTITVDIPITDDDIVEDPMETFTVSLERDPLDPSDVVIISPDVATVVIRDDDRELHGLVFKAACVVVLLKDLFRWSVIPSKTAGMVQFFSRTMQLATMFKYGMTSPSNYLLVDWL